jgi:hypothetical protein
MIESQATPGIFAFRGTVEAVEHVQCPDASGRGCGR